MEMTSFGAYLAILRKRLWVILLVFAATMGVILYRAWVTPPAYRSSVTLQVIALEPEEVSLYTRAASVSTSDAIDLIQFQFDSIVRSERIAQRTLEATGVQMTAAELAGAISTARDAVGDRVTVSITAHNPEDAERLLTQQVESALAELRASRARPAETVGAFLAGELETAERDLATAQAALLKFKLDNTLNDLDREITAEQDAVRALSGAQEDALGAAQRLAAMADEFDQQGQAAQAKAATFAATSPSFAYWNKLAQDFGASAVNRRAEAAGQRAEADSIATRLAKHRTDLTSLITLTGQHQQLTAAVQERQDQRDFLAGKVREAALKQSQSESIGYMRTLGAATTPRNQLPTRTVQVALLGAALSLLAGSVLAFVLEFLDRSLRGGSKTV